MILDSVRLTLGQLFTRRFRGVLWKSIGLTIALLIGLWFGTEYAISTWVLPFVGVDSWMATAVSWITGAGMIIGLGFLIAPVTSIFGGLFIDDIADEVEKKHYSREKPGTPLPIVRSTIISLKFTALVIAANLFALLLLLVPGINLVIFFVVNGYLLGREYFQFVALRHLPEDQVGLMRRHFSSRIFMGGLVIAGFLAIPLLNLLTPLFASAFMTHLFKKLQQD